MKQGKQEMEPRVEQIIEELKERELYDDVVRIARTFHTLAPEVLGRSRLKTVAAARKVVYLFLYKKGFSTPEIGKILRVNHSSVHHGISTSKVGRNEVYAGFATAFDLPEARAQVGT